MRICKPDKKHVAALMGLSKAFAKEYPWAQEIPIGKMTDRASCEEKLFGSQVVEVGLAEDETGKLLGYAGIYCEIVESEPVYYASLLVDSRERNKGIGKALVEYLFERVPSGLAVEAWVGSFNEASLQATPKMGFQLVKSFVSDHQVNGQNQTIYIYKRES